MNARKVPVEVKGFRSVQVWVNDAQRGFQNYRWVSVANDDHADEDSIERDEDSSPDDCPF